MPILSQTLKGHNSETVRPFELKFVGEMYFCQLYYKSTRQVLKIDQSIAIDALSMPALDYNKTIAHHKNRFWNISDLGFSDRAASGELPHGGGG
jgi:hypothetical protein